MSYSDSDPESVAADFPYGAPAGAATSHHKSMFYNTALASVVSPAHTVAYYPLRDYIKAYGVMDQNPQYWCTSRWRGMVTAPEIPLLVSLPWTLTLLTYTATERASGSFVLPSVTAGFAGAVSKNAVRTYSVNVGAKKTFLGEFKYKSALACITGLTAEKGLAFWFHGVTPLTFLHTMWYGAALRSSKWQLRREQKSWWEDVFIVSRTMTFWGVIMTPWRNAATEVVRNLSVDGARRSSFGLDFAKGELFLMKRSAEYMYHTLATGGLRNAFSGSIMLIGKTNFPFATFFATYRLFGGSF